MKTVRQFHNDVIIFETEGISMIGNQRTGSFIGLNENGEKFVRAVREGKEITDAEKVKELDNALLDGGYYGTDVRKVNAAYLHVTDRCNLHCIGCYSFIENRNCQKDLSLSEEEMILDELGEAGVHTLVISGGEPFMRNDIADICKYAHDKGMLIDVISNGTLPIDRYIPALPHIATLNISIDGYNESSSFIRDSGIMPTVLKNIDKLQKLVNVHLIVTLHKKNVDYMEKYLALAKRLNLTFNYSLLTAAEDNKNFKDYLLGNTEFEKIQYYLNQERIPLSDTAMENSGLVCKKRCGAGKTLISIAADGTVYPCHMLHITELAMGNILKNNLRDIIYCDTNEFLTLDVDKLDDCNDCQYRYFCGGGCRARSYLKYHSIKKKCDLCDTNYKFIKENIRKLKNIYGL